MGYTTFNNWNIIPLPSICPRQIDFGGTDSVAVNYSPFTMQSQAIQWAGADWWDINVSYAPMKLPQANQLIAFLLSLRGMANVFQIGDPLGAKPQGSPTGTPVVDGVQQPMGIYLNTRGWTPNRGNLLLPGDYLQLNYRLHRVVGVAPVQSDANGKAQIEIWPSLREAPTDGQSIILTNTTGLFRLSDNRREWTARETRLFGLSFKAIEAR